MIPTSFDESNAVLGPPNGMNEEQVSSLAVCRGEYCNPDHTPCTISCWKMTKEEFAEFKKTG